MQLPRIEKLSEPKDYMGERHCCSECCSNLRKGQKVLVENSLCGYRIEETYSCMKCAPEIVEVAIEQLEYDLKRKLESYIKIQKELKG
jgi:hypothetical protein